jgi:hypothetical protein
MRSPATTAVKIGLSENAPHLRAKALGGSGNYANLGPWEVVDYREVLDMRATEGALHARFAAQRHDHGCTRELFDVPAEQAVTALRETSEGGLVRGDLVGRMRHDPDLVRYLTTSFRATGLDQFLDCQEMWTLSLYPSTAGGRLFTVNIDRHEVAYAAILPGEGTAVFMLHADILIADIPSETSNWFEARRGDVIAGAYACGDERGVSLTWECTLSEAGAVFGLPLMRRALVAYWHDALLDLRDRGKRSVFARHHNHNAVQELLLLGRSAS